MFCFAHEGSHGSCSECHDDDVDPDMSDDPAWYDDECVFVCDHPSISGEICGKRSLSRKAVLLHQKGSKNYVPEWDEQAFFNQSVSQLQDSFGIISSSTPAHAAIHT